MSAGRQFFTRPARYVFDASENGLVRFAAMETRGVFKRAIIRDLSESGLSITLPIDVEATWLPEDGTPLKIEFPIRGGEQIACFATVMRVEQKTEWLPEWGDRGFYLIALQFRHLPSIHLKAIQRALQGRESQDSEINFQSIKRTHGVAFAGLCFATAICMFGMAQPLAVWVRLLSSMYL